MSFRNPAPLSSRSVASLGTYDLQRESARYMAIQYFITHPEYRGWNGGYRHDVALVRLKKKVVFSELVQPVKLPSSNDTFGPSSECFITGWGFAQEGGTSKHCKQGTQNSDIS